MRAVSIEELGRVAGGLLPVGGGGGGGGGGSAPPPPAPTDEQEFENATKAIISLAEQGALDSGVSDLVFKSFDWASLASNVNSQLYQQAEHDYSTYESSGGEHDPPGYFNFINWNHVDWSKYDNNGTATPAQAVKNLLHDIQVNHHFSADKNTTSSNTTMGSYTGGWAETTAGTAQFIGFSGTVEFSFVTANVYVGTGNWV